MLSYSNGQKIVAEPVAARLQQAFVARQEMGS